MKGQNLAKVDEHMLVFIEAMFEVDLTLRQKRFSPTIAVMTRVANG